MTELSETELPAQQNSTTDPLAASLGDLTGGSPFVARHIGPTDDDVQKMLAVVGRGSLAAMVDDAVPVDIRMRAPLDLPAAVTEAEALAELRALAARNRVTASLIGMGYYGTHTPSVILRTVLENPAWYTAYTPYQPEISQGRLEALINFQTVVGDLTGLPVAGASLLDEATAAAEAMTLARRQSKAPGAFLVDADTHPQTVAVLRTRAEPLGLEVRTVHLDDDAALDTDFFAVLVSYPGSSGQVRDHSELAEAAHDRGALVVAATDLLACTVLTPPGEWGADIAIGSAQRFGVPMGFGGPHAGFMSVRKGLERSLPGRLVGASIDADGHTAYRLALQTREQHIRREKATSNICTAQVLLAVMAGMYAVYHGPDGLTGIAARTHRMASLLVSGLQKAEIEVSTSIYFDTVTVVVPGRADEVLAAARDRGISLRRVDADTLGVACDEATGVHQVADTLAAFGAGTDVAALDADLVEAIPTALRRTSEFLTHPTFHAYRSETEMLRYLTRLAHKDFALDRGMIPLGSCTMKLNAATEMEPVTWPEFGGLHPFAPIEDSEGYRSLFADLERWLCEVTGYDAVSLQPNAGSQGELAGLLAIRGYHLGNGDTGRDVCLIPSSAHGTNAASAVMAGMKVVVVACRENGDVDLGDLQAKIDAHAGGLAAIMVTYPSTHGVFEVGIVEVCAKVHDAGGQVYVDGANLNALVGLARPGKFGADVSHLNLHKTFCIPHGGGGPGVGPIGVRAHLSPYLPNHPLVAEAGPASGPGPVSAAPWGSASILPISWAYVRMMGAAGLTRATEVAVLSANYIAARLAPHYPVLYTGANGLVAHECIIDVRGLTKATGVTVDDIAKRLIDHGFHAPTMSFPVAGTLMIEPTESESLAEVDRFCDAMIAIAGEIAQVADGVWPIADSPLRHAPHTAACLVGEWEQPYSREIAVYPSGVHASKYWPPVRRIDGAFGDRNLVCSCPPMEEYDS